MGFLSSKQRPPAGQGRPKKERRKGVDRAVIVKKKAKPVVPLANLDTKMQNNYLYILLILCCPCTTCYKTLEAEATFFGRGLCYVPYKWEK